MFSRSRMVVKPIGLDLDNLIKAMEEKKFVSYLLILEVIQAGTLFYQY